MLSLLYFVNFEVTEILLNVTIEKIKQRNMTAHAKCPECGSRKIMMKADELMCGKCGLILSEGFYSGGEMVF